MQQREARTVSLRWAVGFGMTVALLGQAVPARAQSATVIVTVQSDDGRPLPEALVTLVRASLHARTDSAGVARFHGRVSSGSDSLSARRLGYNGRTLAVVVPQRDTLRVSISLESRVVRVPGIVVNELAEFSWFEEFDRRRARGQGRFITREVLDREHGSELGNIILRRVPGVRVYVNPYNILEAKLFSSRGQNTFRGGGCQVAVFVDGVRDPTGDIGTIPVGLIGAVEYYTPSIAPVQYRAPMSTRGGGSPACGVLLIWTR